MPRTIIPFAKRLTLLLTAALFTMPEPTLAEDRIANARARAEAVLRAAFTKAAVPYPAAELHLRAFKKEAILELWARPDSGRTFRLIATYPILASSGGPGPKRREGDGQVPEGFYEVNRFNPLSAWHLSLGLNYPNAADLRLGHPTAPGTDIFIHGNQVSVGCLPMGDTRIEEIYIAALDSIARPIRVHIFPARMSGESWDQWRAEQVQKAPQLDAFWRQLQPAYDHFEHNKRIPSFSILPDGSYRTAK